MIALLLVAASVVFIDQFTKYLVIVNLPLYFGSQVSPERITVIPGFFEIIHTTNRGGAFGIFSGGSPIFLIVGSIGVLVLLFLYWRIQREDPWIRFALGLILGGAIGNLLDRILRGAVVDWLEFFIGRFHYPTFNIADSAIVVGAFLIVYRAIFFRKDDAPKKTNNELEDKTEAEDTPVPTPSNNTAEE